MKKETRGWPFKFRKIILSGGYVSRAPDGGLLFCKEVVKGIRPPVKVLECIFGLPSNLWLDSIEDDRQMFASLLGDTEVSFDLADYNNFISQIKLADVVYFRGGDTKSLLSKLRFIDGLGYALIGKTVVGSSAGAYVLSSKYVESGETPSLKEGLAYLPIKMVAHYRNIDLAQKKDDEYWDKVDLLLNKTEQNLQTLKLKEGTFEVFEP